MFIKDENEVNLVRGPLNGKHECRIECRKDLDIWNIKVILFEEDEFDISVINEGGYPIRAMMDLVDTYAAILGEDST